MEADCSYEHRRMALRNPRDDLGVSKHATKSDLTALSDDLPCITRYNLYNSQRGRA